MMPFENKSHELTDAVIYTRVSSKAQIAKGEGNASQETYCRTFAGWKGYKVWDVFFDKGVSGARIDRDGIQQVLTFLRKRKGKRRFVVIIDDISRLAREMRVYMDLRDAIDECGAVLESPSMIFGNDSHGRFAEYMQALGAQYFREQNTEQTIKRQTARLLEGFWPFAPVLGYVQEKRDVHGKVMVPVEPLASILREGLEGYATGRFQTQAEVKRFFESFPEFPKTRYGSVTNEAANRILNRLFYAGYVEKTNWGVSLRKGKHEALITLETFNRIQDRLKGRAYVPTRADISIDFPLRGFVNCICGKPLTANWSKSKTGVKHPYYMCFNKRCEHNRKSIRRAQVEGDFEAVLQNVQPAPKRYAFAKAVLKKAWDVHHARAVELKASIRDRIAELERQISTVLDRIVEVSNASVMARLEEKVASLEKEKLAMAEKLAQQGKGHRPFDEMFELAMRFFASPWNIWTNDQLAHKRTVLKLTFSEPLVYDRFGGFRTPKTSMIFSMLESFGGPNNKMAERQGF